MSRPPRSDSTEPVDLAVDSTVLPGDLGIPDDATGIVVFAHGTGSSRKSPRNRHVAEYLREVGLATLLFDLLTEAEDVDRETRFDIDLLAARWLDRVGAPTLLIVGGADTTVRELNREALEKIEGVKRLEVVPGAGHLFEGPGELEEVARLAREWFVDRLGSGSE